MKYGWFIGCATGNALKNIWSGKKNPYLWIPERFLNPNKIIWEKSQLFLVWGFILVSCWWFSFSQMARGIQVVRSSAVLLSSAFDRGKCLIYTRWHKHMTSWRRHSTYSSETKLLWSYSNPVLALLTGDLCRQLDWGVVCAAIVTQFDGTVWHGWLWSSHPPLRWCGGSWDGLEMAYLIFQSWDRGWH